MKSYKKIIFNQQGFSLIELLVGLVIGLLATLVIMQVFSVFEGQKRSTSGSADAQTNGSIALFTMQRDVQSAGFGLPVFDTQNPPLRCNEPLPVDHDSNAATPAIGMFPINIIDGGAGPDSLVVRFATDGANAKAGLPVKIDLPAPVPDVGVENNLGCNNGDVVLISSGTACTMTRVNDTDLAADITHITLVSAAGASVGSSLSCLGRWNQFTYSVANNQLLRNDANSIAATPIVSEIVSIQAQYGISVTAASNQVTQWVDATAPWSAPTVANRNRIKAVRVAIVARNGSLEKTNVDGSATCSSLTAAAPTGLCAWAGSAGSPAPNIDLTADANWQRYRYRVYETIIPLRNMIWSRNTL